MDHAVRRRVPAKVFGSEGALQEIDHGLGAQRMQIRLQRGRSLRPVALALVRSRCTRSSRRHPSPWRNVLHRTGRWACRWKLLPLPAHGRRWRRNRARRCGTHWAWECRATSFRRRRRPPSAWNRQSSLRSARRPRSRVRCGKFPPRRRFWSGSQSSRRHPALPDTWSASSSPWVSGQPRASSFSARHRPEAAVHFLDGHFFRDRKHAPRVSEGVEEIGIAPSVELVGDGALQLCAGGHGALRRRRPRREPG